MLSENYSLSLVCWSWVGDNRKASTATSHHTLPSCREVISVAIAAPKFELRAHPLLWIVAPPGQERPAVSSHGRQMAHAF